VAGQAVQFTDTSTGGPTSWQWNFGDSTTSTSQNPSHSYATAATYTVTLTVTNSSASKSVSQTITVSPASTLTASFTYSPSSPAAGQVVYFTDTSTGSPTSWLWNFGDSATSTSQNSSHSYATAATYTGTLTVTNNSGSKSASQTVTVQPAFAASFTYSPSSPAANQAVQFADTSTGSPTSWQWNFGDNATSTIQNPSHTYAAAGQYWVNLIITKGTNSHSTSQLITVRQPGTITAASPSYADVKAAVDSAVSGDTVIVPAGSATWNSQLVITKGIYLIGAGMANTVIASNYSVSSYNYLWDNSFLITYLPANPSLNEPFRISGLTIDCASQCFGIMLHNTTITPINKVRVDHTKILNPRDKRPACIQGAIYGVADNNEWHGFYMEHFHPDAAWKTLTFDFGTADNFYLEDNLFVGSGDVMTPASAAGTRWCYRYNTFDGSAMTNNLMPHFDAHGNAAWSGVMGVEIYGNTTILPSGRGTIYFDQRGGKALVYNNNVTGQSATGQFREEYLDSLYSPATGPGGQPQHISDSYWWNNRLNSSTKITTRVTQTLDYGGTIGIVPRENVHFWQEQGSFDGTVGIGVGPRSARPVTCTKGVGYWATDEGRLYRATATNTWTLYYTPYTYPHPLRTLLSMQGVDWDKQFVDEKNSSNK
jgi:PKD repeat protein